jgi:hypothetical protein
MATGIASSNGGSIRTWSIARAVGSTPVGPNSDSSADVASGIVLRSVHRPAPLGLCIGQLLPGAWAHRHTTAAASSGGSVHTSRGPANMALSCHASHTRAAQPITRRDIDRYVPSWVLETRFVNPPQHCWRPLCRAGIPLGGFDRRSLGCFTRPSPALPRWLSRTDGCSLATGQCVGPTATGSPRIQSATSLGGPWRRYR